MCQFRLGTSYWRTQVCQHEKHARALASTRKIVRCRFLHRYVIQQNVRNIEPQSREDDTLLIHENTIYNIRKYVVLFMVWRRKISRSFWKRYVYLYTVHYKISLWSVTLFGHSLFRIFTHCKQVPLSPGVMFSGIDAWFYISKKYVFSVFHLFVSAFVYKHRLRAVCQIDVGHVYWIMTLSLPAMIRLCKTILQCNMICTWNCSENNSCRHTLWYLCTHKLWWPSIHPNRLVSSILRAKFRITSITLQDYCMYSCTCTL